MSHESASDIPGADERRREQERIRKEYPDLYYYVAGVALVVALMLVGYVLFPDRDGYLTNLFTEAASVAVTLLVLNRMAEKREKRHRKEQLKQDLIYRMGSQVNSEAIRAVEELRRHGWLTDGSIKEARLFKANLTEAPLRQAILDKAQLRFTNLERAELPNASLREADMSDAKCRQTDLREADFTGAKLVDTCLEGADLSNAILEGANLSFANLKGADLRAANLRRADLSEADLEGARLRGACLEGANLLGVNLPSGTLWHPGDDMTAFTDPPKWRDYS